MTAVFSIDDNGHMEILDGITELNRNIIGEKTLKATSLTIPGSIKTFDEKTFFNLPNLKRVVIKEGVTQLSGELFGSCENLEQVILPKTLEKLGDGAFKNCKALKSICLPPLLSKINDYAFVKSGLGNINIPKSVKIVGTGAFAETELQVFTAENIEFIGVGAFDRCEYLTIFEVDGTMKRLCYMTFWGCRNLKYVALPKALETIDDQAFLDCHHIKMISIPDTVALGKNSLPSEAEINYY